jgi:hypothetical protein
VALRSTKLRLTPLRTCQATDAMFSPAASQSPPAWAIRYFLFPACYPLLTQEEKQAFIQELVRLRGGRST